MTDAHSTSARSAFRRRVMGLLPLIGGAAVLVYLLGFVLQFDNQTASGTVRDTETHAGTSFTITVETDEGESLRISPRAWQYPEAYDPTSIGPPEPGDRIEFTRFGLSHYISRLSASSILNVFMVILAVLALQCWRLQMLLACRGARIGLVRVLQSMMIGLFYGNVLPGGQVGGDPIKALYLSRWSGTGKSQVFAATLIDRAIGLMGLFTIAVVALLARGWSPGFQPFANAIFLVSALGVAFLTLLLVPAWRTRLGLAWLLERMPMAERFSAFGGALSAYRQNTFPMLGAFALSIAAQALMVLIVVIIGNALQAPVRWLDYASLVPIANLVATLPIAPPGGWGIGEGAYVLLFGAVGVDAEAAITLSVISRMAMVLVSLLGIFALFSARRGSGS